MFTKVSIPVYWIHIKADIIIQQKHQYFDISIRIAITTNYKLFLPSLDLIKTLKSGYCCQ